MPLAIKHHVKKIEKTPLVIKNIELAIQSEL